MTESILLQNVNADQFKDIITTVIKQQLTEFKQQLNAKADSDELLSREQVLELLQINASTLWHWQNKGRINVYKFASKCYYKKSEIMSSVTLKR